MRKDLDSFTAEEKECQRSEQDWSKESTHSLQQVAGTYRSSKKT